MTAARPLLIALLAALALLAFGAGAAHGRSPLECSGFTAASVQDACDAAAPVDGGVDTGFGGPALGAAARGEGGPSPASLALALAFMAAVVAVAANRRAP